MWTIVWLKVTRNSCQQRRFCVAYVLSTNVFYGWESVRIVNFVPRNWASKNFGESIIANSSSCKGGYLNCAGLNLREWNLAGLMLSSVSCCSHKSNPIWLASNIRHFGSSLVLCYGLITWLSLITSFLWLHACKCMFVHLQVQVVAGRSVRIAAEVARLVMKWDKWFTNSRKAWNCLLSLVSVKSKIFGTLCGSAESPSLVNMYYSMLKRLVKNWHLLCCNQNCWSCRHCKTFRKASTCCL